MGAFIRIAIFLFFIMLSTAQSSMYTLAVSTTSDLQGALDFKKKYLYDPKQDVFITQVSNKKYATMYGCFNSLDEIKQFQKMLPKQLTMQKPFIKEFNYDLNISNDPNIIKFSCDMHLPESLLNRSPLSFAELKQSIKDIPTYSYSVCSVAEYQNALECIKLYIPNPKADIYIIKDSDRLYKTLYGSFSTYQEAKEFSKEFTANTKSQAPFIKKIFYDLNDSNNILIRISNPNSSEQDSDIEEENNAIPIKSATKLPSNTSPFAKFQELFIKVNSINNTMLLEGMHDGKYTILKKYTVSTARKDIPKPQGVGNVTSISLNPVWYPTEETKKYFKEIKHIDLPTVVPYGDVNNFMGAAKINLTHTVNGENVYRIHGTVDDSTIGQYESAGCIRMKNKDVRELAKILLKFTRIKDIQHIKVFLN